MTGLEGEEILLAPVRIAAFTAALLAALWVASWLARRLGTDPSWSRNTAAAGILSGLVAARLGHVAANWPAYAAEPWSVLLLWQPGYLPAAGLAAGAAVVLLRLAARPPEQRLRALRPVVTGLAAGATLLAALYGGARLGADAGVLRAGDTLPDFELVNLVGEPVSTRDLRGKGVVLNYWATWCPPCRREMPLLESAWTEYRSRGVVVIGIAVGQSAGEVRPFVDSMGVSYPIWLEPSSPGDQDVDTWDMLEQFGSAGLPTTAFVSPDGEIREVHIGELNREILAEHLPPVIP